MVSWIPRPQPTADGRPQGAPLHLATDDALQDGPHAGGVGLCEYISHLVMVDYTRIGASLENRVAEYVEHLHEHFENPVVIKNAHYMPPTALGYSITMKPDSLREFQFPHGPVWQYKLGRSGLPA